MTPDDDKQLESTFAKIRAEDVPLSEGLMDQIMMDADSVLAGQAPAASAATQPGLWDSLLDAIGGWPSFSGLAAATVAGLWIGVALPDAVTNVTDVFWGGTFEVPVLDGDLLSALEG